MPIPTEAEALQFFKDMEGKHIDIMRGPTVAAYVDLEYLYQAFKARIQSECPQNLFPEVVDEPAKV
jgi:hypothetical protein